MESPSYAKRYCADWPQAKSGDSDNDDEDARAIDKARQLKIYERMLFRANPSKVALHAIPVSRVLALTSLLALHVLMPARQEAAIVYGLLDRG